MLPITIIVKLLMMPFNYKSIKNTHKDVFNIEAKNIINLKDRTYDIVLVGATGFTGKFSCEYLARTYNNKIKWAISGRRENALKDIKIGLDKK